MGAEITPYDRDLQERLITGFGTVVDMSGGINAKGGPQIREALLLAYAQVAVQEGFQIGEKDRLCGIIAGRMGDLFPAMIERNRSGVAIMLAGRIPPH